MRNLRVQYRSGGGAGGVRVPGTLLDNLTVLGLTIVHNY